MALLLILLSLLSFLTLFESVVRASGVEDDAPPLERRGSTLMPRSAKGEIGGRTQDGAVKGVRRGERDMALGRRAFLVGLLILKCPFWTGCVSTGRILSMLLLTMSGSTVLLWIWLWVIGCKLCAPTGCDCGILGSIDDDEVGVLWRVVVVEEETLVDVEVVDRGEDVDEGVGDDEGGDKVEGISLRMSALSPCL